MGDQNQEEKIQNKYLGRLQSLCRKRIYKLWFTIQYPPAAILPSSRARLLYAEAVDR